MNLKQAMFVGAVVSVALGVVLVASCASASTEAEKPRGPVAQITEVRHMASGHAMESGGAIIAHAKIYAAFTPDGTLGTAVDSLLEVDVFFTHVPTGTNPTVIRSGCPVSTCQGSYPYEVSVFAIDGSRVAVVQAAPPPGLAWNSLSSGDFLTVTILLD